MIRHSFSAEHTFEGCERRLYYEKVLRLPQAASHYLSVGNFYHAAFAGVLEGTDVGIDWLPGLLKRVKAAEPWACDVTDQALIIETAAAIEQVRRLVLPHVRPRAVEQWAKGPYTAKLDVLSDWAPVAGEDGVAIGHTEDLCVLDWKVRFGAPKRERSEAQLALYCLATGAKHAGFCEVYRDGRPPRLQMVRFDDYDLARWERFYDQQFAAMDSRGTNKAAYKLASPDNPLCSSRWCPHWRYCEGGEGNAAAQPVAS